MTTQTVTQPTLTLRPSPSYGVPSAASPSAGTGGPAPVEDEDIAKFDYGPPPPTFEDKHEERAYLKERLALAYRVLARECKPEGAAGHLSVRDPVDPECFWVRTHNLSHLLTLLHCPALTVR